MIKTLLFDMGNVLVFFSHERMCANIGRLCGRTASQVRTLLFDSNLNTEFESGRFTEQEFHARWQMLTERDIEFESLVTAGSDIFELNAPIVPVLDALRTQGFRLVLLSNTSISHFRWVSRQFSVLDRFDDYVLSYEAGAVKPDPAIFAAALRAIRCEPDECFYTDDIAAYVAEGRRHGLQAEVFTGVPTLLEHLAARGIEIDVLAR